MTNASQIKLFSLKRLLLAIVLGFLIPLSYSVLLSLASDVAQKSSLTFWWHRSAGRVRCGFV